MQPSHTARLALAVALACAATAHAATGIRAATSTPSTGSASTANAGSTATAPALVSNNNATFVRSSTAIPSPASGSASTAGTTTGNSTTPQTSNPANVTTVDVRNQQTQAAVAGTHASGSTSALGTLANGNVETNSTAGTGTTSGAGATGTGSSTATDTGTGTTTGTGSFGTAPGFPAFGSGTVGGSGIVVMPANGNPADSTAGAAVAGATNGTILAQGLTGNDVLAGAVIVPNANAGVATTNGVNVDRAINQVSRDRKRVGRNGQLLYSVAPRTNADRGWQMPDDGPSPALTGSNSTLTR